MVTLKEINSYGEDLERMLRLSTSPVAVKMLERESDIPEGAIQPTKDRGYHLAQCQAFAMSRREGATVAMLRDDNWCPGPLVSYGLVPPDSAGNSKHVHDECEHFEYGKYIGILTAPLKTATFDPDVVIMYSDNYQLTNLFCSLPAEEQSMIGSHFFAPSCVYAVTTPMVTGRYQVVLPDAGEYVRALTPGGEIMFSIPRVKLEGLVEGLRRYAKEFPFLLMANMMMRPDFPMPEPYRKAFESWGMHTGK